MCRFSTVTLVVLFLSFIAICGCEGLVRDTQSLFIPRFHRSEILALWQGSERHLPLCQT
jgi:hypothetical protein